MAYREREKSCSLDECLPIHWGNMWHVACHMRYGILGTATPAIYGYYHLLDVW